jgi:hypothetical protein
MIITEHAWRLHTRSENIYTFAVVGEVRTLITKSGGTDSHSLFSCCRRVVAGILVIVA